MGAWLGGGFLWGGRGRAGHVVGRPLQNGEFYGVGWALDIIFTEGPLPKLCSVEHETFEMLWKTTLLISVGDTTYCITV